MALKNVGALWRKEGKNGHFYSGTLNLGALGDVNIGIFKTEKGEGDENKPDARICLFEKDTDGE